MPPSSWSAIESSCSGENHPGNGADIELWVAASAICGSDRLQRVAEPLHGGGAGAASVTPPEPKNPPSAATSATATTTHAATSARVRERRAPGSATGACPPCGRLINASSTYTPL